MTLRLLPTLLASLLSLAASASSVDAAATLSVDVNSTDDETLTQPGFEPWTFPRATIQSPTTKNFAGGIAVTIFDAGTDGYEGRTRSTPENSGAFIEANLLRDFIYSNNDVDRGLDVLVEGLVPYGIYNGSIWGFDTQSEFRNRYADWSANGYVLRDDFNFNGDTEPPASASNDQYRFDFQVAANANGQLLLKGRRDRKSGAVGVFLNAFQLDYAGSVLASQIDPGPALSVDFGPGVAETGFSKMDLSQNGSLIDGKRVTLTAVGSLDRRQYDVYANFWTNENFDWQVKAGLSPDSLTLFNPSNAEQLGTIDEDRTLFRAYLGTVDADLADVTIYVDDKNASGEPRTWFDSVGFAPAGSEYLPGETFVQVTTTNAVGAASGLHDWVGTAAEGKWNPRSGFGTFGTVWESRSQDAPMIAVHVPSPASETGGIVLDQRNRSTGPSDAGAFTQGDLLQDFIFASTGDFGTSGLDATVEYLVPNQLYYVTVWSYDALISSTRFSEWYANGELVNGDFRYSGSSAPLIDGDESFSFLAAADDEGTLVVSGRVSAKGTVRANDANVLISALRLQAVVPEPSGLALGWISLAEIAPARNVGRRVAKINSTSLLKTTV